MQLVLFYLNISYNSHYPSLHVQKKEKHSFTYTSLIMLDSAQWSSLWELFVSDLIVIFYSGPSPHLVSIFQTYHSHFHSAFLSLKQIFTP